MIDTKKASSRPLAVAASLAGREIDEESFLEKLVVLTSEASALSTENGRWCFLDALRLLIRTVGRLVVVVPEGFEAIEADARLICRDTSFRTTPTIIVGSESAHLSEAVAVLNVGCQTRPDLPWISVAAEGWVAFVTTCDTPLQSTFFPANPMSSLFAASVGVSEVFRKLVGVPTSKVPELGALQISLFDLGTSIGRESSLPTQIPLPNTMLVGAGAIGNGVALLASQLPLSGRLHIVDYQKYGDENLGTSVLVENHGWVGEYKALRLSEWLTTNSQLETTGEKKKVLDAVGGESCRQLKPELLLNALDDVQARHDAQMLWPSYTFDGGIGEFGIAVIQHRLDDRGLACLRCSFKLPERDDKEVQRLATGLSVESLQELERELTLDDVSKAAPQKQQWLTAKLKERKTVCSVVSEATLERQGVDADEDFRPSVPFVATAAAALMMAEVVKTLCHGDANYHQAVVIGSLLLGHASVGHRNRAADPECVCVRHRSVIDQLRARRQCD